MADAEETIQTKFHLFLQQRNSKGNATMQEAQKLINLYRLLNCLGENFVDKYNEMLLGASDEVLMSMNALVGGQEVRQYFDFLTLDKQKETSSEDGEVVAQNTGWLPSPETEVHQSDKKYVSTDEWNSFVQTEKAKITELISKIKDDQDETLRRLTDQLTTSLAVKSDMEQNSEENSSSEYSEIIEDKGKERP